MTQLQIAWLAGLLEGEGCFAKQTHGNGILITLSMTDSDIVERAAVLMSARLVRKIAGNSRWKDTWIATVYGDRAAEVMREILPYMGKRRTAKILAMLKVNASKITYAEAGRRGGHAGAGKPKPWKRTKLVQIA